MSAADARYADECFARMRAEMAAAARSISKDGKYLPGVVQTTFCGDFNFGRRTGFPNAQGEAPNVPIGASSKRTRSVGGDPTP